MTMPGAPSGTPWAPPFTAVPPPSPRSPRPGWGRAGIAAAMVATAIGGGIAGALLTAATQHTTSTTTAATATTAADTHTQDVRLCTAYATINAVRPKPETNGMEVLPAATALQLAIDGNPGASASIREALADVVTVFYQSMAAKSDVHTRGLADPPAYDKDRAQVVYDRAWDACRLDG